MTSSFVLVNQAFSSHSVKYWSSSRKCSLCSFFVTASNCSDYFLDACTSHRTTASVMLATLFGLDCTLLSRLNVSQGVTPKINSCQKRGCGLCLPNAQMSNDLKLKSFRVKTRKLLNTKYAQHVAHSLRHFSATFFERDS